MKSEAKTSLKFFLIEVVIYGAVVVAYYFLVLHFLGGWLSMLFHNERRIYAAVALGLIVGQGLALEVLTRAMLSFLKQRNGK